MFFQYWGHQDFTRSQGEPTYISIIHFSTSSLGQPGFLVWHEPPASTLRKYLTTWLKTTTDPASQPKRVILDLEDRTAVRSGTEISLTESI